MSCALTFMFAYWSLDTVMPYIIAYIAVLVVVAAAVVVTLFSIAIKRQK